LPIAAAIAITAIIIIVVVVVTPGKEILGTEEEALLNVLKIWKGEVWKD